MADISVTRKQLTFRWLAAELTLNVTNAPWLSNVLKIEGLTTPSSSGANSVSSYTGAGNNQTPGGTLQKLEQGKDYRLNSSSVAGWTLPNAVLLIPPTISSIAPLSVSAGSLLNITGTALLTTKHVYVAGARATISTGATTSTNVTVTVPLTAAVGTSQPVLLITEVGSALVTTLTVTGSSPTKLATPVINTPVSTTATSAYFTWGAISGADSYLFTLNNGTTYPLGNTTSYTATGLAPGTTVLGSVVAKDSSGTKLNSDASATVTTTTLTQLAVVVNAQRLATVTPDASRPYTDYEWEFVEANSVSTNVSPTV